MIGHKIITFEEIDSTNDFIKKHQHDLDDGTIVVAAVQTKGRGRGNHVWESQKGNLYLSFILKDGISYGRIFSILTRVCVTVVNLLGRYNISAKIKYPNDILVENKKISGILIETYGNLKLESLIVGVGINVNQDHFTTILDKATSVWKETQKKVDVTSFMNQFIIEYNKTLNVDDMSIFDEYLKYSMVIGKGIDYEGNQYTINTISSSGELLLKNESTTKRLPLNEISLEDLYEKKNN